MSQRPSPASGPTGPPGSGGPRPPGRDRPVQGEGPLRPGLRAGARADDEAQEAERARLLHQLAGGIAHDLNNMLAVILAGAEAAHPTQGLPPSDVSAVLEDVRWAALRARDVVRQILSFAGRDRPERRLVSLRDVVSDSLDVLRSGALGPLTIDYHAPQEPLPVDADPVRVDQVIVNLARNAVQAMEPDGGGVLRVALRRQEDERLHGPCACLEVRDSGNGIPDSVHPHIFEPFFTTRADQGATGMGLAEAQGIVELHGGRIEAESEPGSGTCVRVWMPLCEGAAEAGLGVHRVLLVSSEEMVLRATERLLQQQGCEVTTCSSGADAEAYLARDPESTDAVLTDFRISDGDGIRLAERLRERAPALPILLMTGNQEAIDAERLRAAPLAAILPKPISSFELIRALGDLPG